MLHSGLPDIERAREWWRVRHGEARIVVGTRSAVFAPLENLGLIIVDEEQESSYKQEETPRYNGRDTAVYRARLEGAVVLLGSATPSLETYHNARAGKYQLLELASRVENRPLADVRIVDLREEFRRAAPRRARFGNAARRHRAAARRRHAGDGADQPPRLFLVAAVPRLRRVRAVPELQHRAHVSQEPPAPRMPLLRLFDSPAESSARSAMASICISSETAPSAWRNILREQFPKARIARLDRDTVRTKREYQQVLGAFAEGEIDVLVGTQMVAKGHDFQRVTLVGVVAADLALGRPDFRAAERTFQLLTQVAGRAGRGELVRRSSRGDVLSRSTTRFSTRRSRITFRSTRRKRTSGACCTTRRSRRWPACWCATAKSRTQFAGRARSQAISRRLRRTRREDSRSGRRAARAPAPRIPVSVCAEVAAALGALRKRSERLPGFLRLEGNSGDGRDCGRGSDEFRHEAKYPRNSVASDLFLRTANGIVTAVNRDGPRREAQQKNRERDHANSLPRRVERLPSGPAPADAGNAARESAARLPTAYQPRPRVTVPARAAPSATAIEIAADAWLVRL